MEAFRVTMCIHSDIRMSAGEKDENSQLVLRECELDESRLTLMVKKLFTDMRSTHHH